jgi:4-aminobutyrate aminotransferase/(S)-3-amino-2-methylpropionate transaminase
MEKFRVLEEYPLWGTCGPGGHGASSWDKKNPVERRPDRPSWRCYDKGLIILTAGGYGNVIRHLVPLVVTDEQLDKGLRILEEVMAEKVE